MNLQQIEFYALFASSRPSGQAKDQSALGLGIEGEPHAPESLFRPTRAPPPGKDCQVGEPMDVAEEDKKTLKAWLTSKRNKRDWLIYKHLKTLREQEKEREKQEEQMLLSRRPVESAPEELWSAKTQEVRNRLTDKKRQARERWNRFAGTGESGGRGL